MTTSEPSQPLPSTFETLAGISKFIAVAKISPDFYEQNWKPIEFACSFVRAMAQNYPVLELAMRKALPKTLKDGAPFLEEAFFEMALPLPKAEWFDAQMTEVLRQLVPVVRDPKLPDWLAECKWAIEGAFY